MHENLNQKLERKENKNFNDFKDSGEYYDSDTKITWVKSPEQGFPGGYFNAFVDFQWNAEIVQQITQAWTDGLVQMFWLKSWT